MARRLNLSIPLIFTILITQGLWKLQAIADYCQPKKADFEALCANLDGVTDGGRCFFIPLVRATSWSSAWGICESFGGTLAQFHTESEFGKATNLVASQYPKYNGTTKSPLGAILMAYFDTVWLSITDKSQCESIGQAHWYDTETTYAAGLSRSNTLAKYYDCQDNSAIQTAPRCYSLEYYDEECASGFFRYNFWYPACMINNKIQSYSRSGNCLTEAVIESTPGATANECANECSFRSGWCRSYNFMYYGDGNIGNRCDIFSRSVLDCDTDPGKCPMKTSETVDCIHYNYIP